MAHTSSVKVRFYELDPYNHVNHTNYLRYFESARIELLDDMGFGLDVMRQEGVHMVVVELNARFIAPAGLHDVLVIETTIGTFGRATSTWHQTLTGDDGPVATLDIVAAFTNVEGRPRRVPPEFISAAEAL